MSSSSSPGAAARAASPPETVPATDMAESGDATSADAGLAAVLALFASFVGVVALAYSIYAFKYLGLTTIGFLPSRVFFVLALGLAAVPFLLVMFYRRVPYVFVVVPIALVFLLYPLLSPFGQIYGQDALFNYQFAASFLNHALWVPGGNTTGQATTYAFYPAPGLFHAEGSVFTGVALTTSFSWMLPITRLLILPPIVYAIGSRMLGSRAGLLGVFIYMASPSITFNNIVNQEFAVLFFALGLGMITFLAYAPREDATPLRLLVLIFSSFVIISHHLSSYILGVWLASLAVVPLLLWGHPEFPKARSGVVALRYFILFLIFTFFFTAPVLLGQLTVLEKNILLLLSNTPLGAKSAAAGSSYPTYQLIWIILGLGMIVVLSLLTLRRALTGKHRPYLATSLVAGGVILLVSFVLFATPYSFVAIRTTEYALVFAAPAAAWYLVHRYVPAVDRILRPQGSGRAHGRNRSPMRWVAPVSAVVLAFLVFTGGSLVPGESRDQYAPASALNVNSPMHLTPAAFQDGVWAQTHLNHSYKVWGDMLVYDVYAGIGLMNMPFNTYEVFNGSSFTPNNTYRLDVGDYVITDKYDYSPSLIPDFNGKSAEQPTGPLSPAQLDKFDNASHFSTVFADPLFTVYQVTVPFYFVTFTADRLPAGASWSVTLGGVTQETSTNLTLSFLEPNGSYPYAISVSTGYTISPASGTATVAGATTSVKVFIV